MASNIDPATLDWLNKQFNPTTGSGVLNAPGGGEYRPIETSTGSMSEGNLSTNLTGWAQDTTPGKSYQPGSQYDQFSSTGEYQNSGTYQADSFMDSCGPFLIAALPFAAAMSPAIAAALTPSAGMESGVAASGAMVGGPMSVGGAVGTDLAAGAGMTGGVGALAGGAAFPGAAASADILAPAGMGAAGGAGGASAIPAIGSLIKGGLGLASANQVGNAATQGAATADPFGSQRAQYAKMLSDLMADPSTISKQPGWEAGSEAVQRAGAAQGFTGSGNMATALQKYGGDFYNSTVSTLSNLAGAQFSPSTAGQIQAQGGVNQSQAQGNAIGTLIQGASSLIPMVSGG